MTINISLKTQLLKERPMVCHSSSRVRLMKWMTESNWSWHVVHTDHMSILMPIHYEVGGPEFAFMQTSFGKNNNEQNHSPN